MPGQYALAIGASLAAIGAGAACRRRRRLIAGIAVLAIGWWLLRAWLLWRAPDDVEMAEDWFNGLTVGWAGVEIGAAFGWLALCAGFGWLARKAARRWAGWG